MSTYPCCGKNIFNFGPKRTEREIVEKVEYEIDAICNYSDKHCSEPASQIESKDMWGPVSIHLKYLIDAYNADSIPEEVVEGGLQFLAVLRSSLPPSSLS